MKPQLAPTGTLRIISVEHLKHHGEPSKLRSATGAGLLPDSSKVSVDSVARDAHPICNLGVRESSRKVSKDLTFSRGQFQRSTAVPLDVPRLVQDSPYAVDNAVAGASSAALTAG